MSNNIKKTYMSNNNKTELDITIEICKWLRKEGFLFYCDIAAGLKLTSYQAMLVSKMRSGRGLPDIIVFCRCKGGEVGFAFEVKRSVNDYLRSDGSYRNSKHIMEQLSVMGILQNNGFICSFVTSVDEVKRIIELNKK